MASWLQATLTKEERPFCPLTQIAPPENVTERILIVDDEELIVLAMGRYFERLGYAVDSANELEEAQALLAANRYDLVIADLRLTGVGGVEGLQIVSEVHDRSAHTRVILLSAFGTPEIERESYNRGADAFLHKPKAMMEIAEIARTLLRS
ncbi:MAG TPA: response regulator [Thermoanaerobaculia bacterium]|nr:response regulator [Thermoanaerobaculia bacterium]